MSATQDYAVAGMRCAACAAGLQTRAGEAPGVAAATADFASRRLFLTTGEGFDEDAFRAEMEGAGFVLHSPGAGPSGQDASPGRAPFGLALALGLPVLAHHAGVLPLPAAAWTEPALAVAVMVTAGAEFFLGAARALAAGYGNMDVLVALGAGAAFLHAALVQAAVLAPASGGHDASFSGAVMLLLFVRGGRELEARVRASAQSALDLLETQAPVEARMLKADGSERALPAAGLRRGDRVRVLAGEPFPVDGEVEEGQSQVEEALLTGEPLPIPKGPGDSVLAGSRNLEAPLVVLARRVHGETFLDSVARASARGLAERPPLQRVADRVAAVFVPGVLALAAATFAAWWALGGDPARAWSVATSVVVIACPCALGLATPTAVMVASRHALHRGILLRSAAGLEALATADLAALDKTGTLTQGRFEVVEAWAAADQDPAALRAVAARLEAGAHHPLAAALRRGAPEGPPAEARCEHPGQGVEGRVGGTPWHLGSRAFVAAAGASAEDLDGAAEALDAAAPGSTHAFLATQGRLAGAFALGDVVRPDAADLVAGLRARGLEALVLTGDRAEAAAATCDPLGVPVEAGLTPDDKRARVAAAREAGRRVVFLGDGVNDAQALAAASVGVAMGGGAALARESGDLVLLREDPSALLEALDLARETRRVIRRNLAWAFGYNLLALPLAAGVAYPWTGQLLPPHLAGLAMALSSISVVASSALLRAPTPRSGAPVRAATAG